MTDSTRGSFAAAYFNQGNKRERSMTDSTTGSFASYFSQGNEQEQLPQPPVEVEEPRSRISSVSHDDLEARVEQQEQETQWQATDASNTSDTLHQLSEGIRIITRQMKYAHNNFQGEEAQSEQEYQSWSDSCSILSCTSDDERRLSDISRQLKGSLGTSLMGLSHAAQMLGKSSRMASDEASLLMRDVRVTQDARQEAQQRANKAESTVKMLYTKQKSLAGELEQAKIERNVLKRQVKALLKEKSVLEKKTEAVRVLELHVVSALKAHEMVLRQSKLCADGKEVVSPNVATVRLERSPQEESASANVEAEVDEQHFEAEKETTESKVRSTSPDCETFVEVNDETNKKNTANEADTSTSTNEEASIVSTETQQKRRVGGFGTAIGFGGSWRYKQKSQLKLAPAATKIVDITHEAKQAHEPVMITPTHSVDELERHGLDLSHKEFTITSECSRGTTPSPTNTSVASDDTKSSLATGNHSRSVSPSPTEAYTGTRMKSFFRGTNNKPKEAVEKPLRHLDGDSVDPTESSQDCISESAPSSDSTSIASALTCGGPPPKSLSCDTTTPVSPFSHDFANVSPTDVLLDDRDICSLAIPSIDDTPRKVVKPIPAMSTYESFVEVTEQTTKKNSANEADTSTSTNEDASIVSPETQEKRRVGGFGGAIGFGGSWLYKQKSQLKLAPETTKTVDITHEAERAHEPIMITPSHSVDELERHGLNLSHKESIITSECSRGTTPSPTNTSVASDNTKSSLATGNHSRAVSPSPTEAYTETRMKKFFRGNKPKGAIKKPLLHLDDDSVDPSESAQKCISKPAPRSDSTSVASALACGGPPPKSLMCDTTTPSSPFLHDFTNAPPTDVLLDDRVIRSLAIPSVDDTPKKVFKPIPVLPTCCPPEIAQIYAEIGRLHEC